MSYRDYQSARDAAWRILLDCGVDRLPVNLNTICRRLKIRVLTYGGNIEIIEQAHLSETVRSTDGLTFYLHQTPVILFDETVLPEWARFTIAHEIGHILLGHTKPGGTTPSTGNHSRETTQRKQRQTSLRPGCWPRRAFCGA